MALSFVGPAQGASASATVTVTIRIPVLQQLSITSNEGGVSAKEEGNNSIRTEIDISNLDSPSDLSIPEAIDVEVLSNVDWHLMAEFEGSYVNFANDDPSPSVDPRIELSVNPSSPADFSYSDLTLAEGDQQELAQGPPTNEAAFSVDYELKLESVEDLSNLSGVGGDVVYTLMEL